MPFLLADVLPRQELLDRFKGVDPGADGLPPSPAIRADSGDYESLLAMCARAKCVVACAGPFSEYGEGVVRACVETKTDYVDITGEIPWVEDMYRKYSAEAERNGVSIVSLAGYDSVPPDLTTYLAAKAVETTKDRLARFEAFVGSSGGALPTGTVNTVMNKVDEGKNRVLHLLSFGLLGSAPNKDSEPMTSTNSKKVDDAGGFVPRSVQASCSSNLFWSLVPGYSSLAGQFCVPHFMAPANTPTVHHTAERRGYGGIVYRERLGGLPRGLLSLYGLIPMLMSVGVMALLCILALLPYHSVIVKRLRDRYNTPLVQRVRRKAFDGFQSTGKTYVHGYGVSERGVPVKVTLSAAYDAGLGFTMLSACTVASELVKRFGTTSATAGCCSAVEALGGESLAGALKGQGVQLRVLVEGQPSGGL